MASRKTKIPTSGSFVMWHHKDPRDDHRAVEVTAYWSKRDGALVIEIDGNLPADDEALAVVPRVRVNVNDCYFAGKPYPEG
jgi:hypothetical protein